LAFIGQPSLHSTFTHIAAARNAVEAQHVEAPRSEVVLTKVAQTGGSFYEFPVNLTNMYQLALGEDEGTKYHLQALGCRGKAREALSRPDKALQNK